MDLKRLLVLISTNTYEYLDSNREIIRSELNRLDISSKDQPDLIEKIIKISKIVNNPKTRESYLRSYFRVFQDGIDADGRGSSIIIEITKKCVKNCAHCYSKFSGKKQEMSDDTLDAIIKYARSHVKHIFLTGGEPTVDPRVFVLAQNNPDILFFVFTNGSTMTDAYAKRISSFGNIIPLLGIDGGSASAHDMLRGKGSYTEVKNAIDVLNKNNVSWGYISLVTEKNAYNVLGKKFINDKIKKGAFIARYLEYLPVGPKPLRSLILSGETYYFLEKRKKEIIKSGSIYIQETMQEKCNGLLYFDVDGNIKNCFCFHYAKYNVASGDIKASIHKTRSEWTSYSWVGECPLYSDAIRFKDHLEKIGWKRISFRDEEYLSNPSIASQLSRNYKRFLEIKAVQGL